MIYGYARVSTDGQRVDAQVAQLEAAGAERVFREVASGAKADRKALARALAALSAGDMLMVTRLDRLARSTRDLLNVLAAVADKGAGFRSLADQWGDTTTPHGRLMITILGGLAQQAVEDLSREIEALRASRIVGERLAEITVRAILLAGWIILLCGVGVPLFTIFFPKLAELWTLQLIGLLVATFVAFLTIIGIGYFDFLRRLDRWAVTSWCKFLQALLERRNKNTLRSEPKL